jgi:hypothetical protein
LAIGGNYFVRRLFFMVGSQMIWLSLAIWLVSTELIAAWLYLENKRWTRQPIIKQDPELDNRIKDIVDQISTIKIQSGIRRREQ